MKNQDICNEDGQRQLNSIKDPRTQKKKVSKMDFSGHMRHF